MKKAQIRKQLEQIQRGEAPKKSCKCNIKCKDPDCEFANCEEPEAPKCECLDHSHCPCDCHPKEKPVECLPTEKPLTGKSTLPAWEEKFKPILGGYCWSADGGNGGYSFDDVTAFIKELLAQKEQEVRELETKIIKSLKDQL